MKEPTCGYRHCDTSQVLMFGGYLAVWELFDIIIESFSKTCSHHDMNDGVCTNVAPVYKWMHGTNNRHPWCSIKEPTHSWVSKNCDTSEILMFGGCLKVRESLYLWVNITSMLTLGYALMVYVRALLLYVSDCIVWRINIHNGVKAPTLGCQNCETSQILMFGGYLCIVEVFSGKHFDIQDTYDGILY